MYLPTVYPDLDAQPSCEELFPEYFDKVDCPIKRGDYNGCCLCTQVRHCIYFQNSMYILHKVQFSSHSITSIIVNVAEMSSKPLELEARRTAPNGLNLQAKKSFATCLPRKLH